MSRLQGIDVVVLAGGLGTRIQGVLGDTPKVLASINGRPFLDHLLDRLAAEGAGRVILSLGHRAQAVEAHLAGLALPLEVECVVEPAPLGTGGALRYVAARLSSDPVMVMNGDTWIEADFGGFLATHREAGREQSLLAVEVPDIARFGSLFLAPDFTVAQFVEKDPARQGRGLINGGVYLFSRAGMAALCACGATSLERDYLMVLPPGAIHAHVAQGAAFVDIGTPESLAGAGTVLPQ